MLTVPVRATWPHPQNRATPEKQRIVATSDAYGTPPKHLMQHSKQPMQKGKKEKIVTDNSNSISLALTGSEVKSDEHLPSCRYKRLICFNPKFD